MTAREPARPTQRLEGTGEDVGRSLGRLVVTLLEAVRQVIERQAVRRVEGGDLDDAEIERLGQALIELEDTFDELRESFGVRPEDLFLPLDLQGLLAAADPGAPRPAERGAPDDTRETRPRRNHA